MCGQSRSYPAGLSTGAGVHKVPVPILEFIGAKFLHPFFLDGYLYLV